MEGEAFFLDSYAIHKIAESDEKYRRFATKIKILTTRLNLMEVYYAYLMRNNETGAEMAYERFREFCVKITDEDFKSSMKFKQEVRRKNPKSNISYIVAVGYTIAKRYKAKFLTGDREFRDIENVEFVP